MVKLLSITKEFVADYFSQSRQFLKSVIFPARISDGQIKKFKQSIESLLEASVVASSFRSQGPLILAAHIPQLIRQRKAKPATGNQIWMIRCHLYLALFDQLSNDPNYPFS